MFDWDGTLVDTAEASSAATSAIFASFGIAFDRDVYARALLAELVPHVPRVGLPEECWADADERWLAHFAEEKVALIDGVHDARRSLGRARRPRAIVTSGSRDA